MVVCLTLAVVGSAPLSVLARTVTSLAAHGEGSLRQAVADAQAGAVITFADQVRGEIVFNASDLEILVDKALSIVGPGAESLAISGAGVSRLLHVTASGSLTIEDLTLRMGHATVGGAVWNKGYAEIIRCVLTDNFATESGGAIQNEGRLKLIGCSILRNQASGKGSCGGGVCSVVEFGRGWLEGENCTFAWNEALLEGKGGALFSQVFVPRVIGLDQPGLRLTQCTISSNGADQGGGIFGRTISARLSGPVPVVGRIERCTIAFNRLSGIRVELTGDYRLFEPPRIQVSSSIIANNDGDQCDLPNLAGVSPTRGPLESLGYNLVSDGTLRFGVGGDQHSVDPELEPLAANGGMTLNHLPRPGSPAIDAGGPTPPNVDDDQRGAARVVRGGCAKTLLMDTGAVEFQPALPPVFAVDFTNILPNRSVPLQNFAFPLGVPKSFVAQLFAGGTENLIGAVGGPVFTTGSGYLRGGSRCLGPGGRVAVFILAWDHNRNSRYEAALADREGWLFRSNDFWVTNAADGPAVLGGLTSFHARPPVRWPALEPVEFGSVLTTNQLNARLDVPLKDATYTVYGAPAAGARLCPGEHEVVAKLTPVNTAQYLPVTATNLVKVQVRIHLEGSSLVVRGCPDATIEFQGSSDLASWSPLGAALVDGYGDARMELGGAPGLGVHFYQARWVP